MSQVNQVKNGARFIKDIPHRESHDRCLWNARMRRDQTAQAIPEWEEMRDLASQIKEHTLSHLDQYLEEFENNATANGIHIHWAETPEEHNEIIYQLLKQHNVTTATTGKSMTMDECDLRGYVERRGMYIHEADLGECIQQLDNQMPDHIVVPAIHKLRQDVATLFAKKLGSDPDITDPHYLNGVMRAYMRKKYEKIEAGLCGVNFAIAETGGICVCSNEGDVDISQVVPPLLIASMGIEKVIPTLQDVALYVRLLSRSALGLDITQYTTHIHHPQPGQEMHIVILDNGRSKRLGAPDYWQVLKCIRCGACMNTCPVFRRTSGLSYEAVYMGPIGCVLMPSYDLHRYARLPYSCTHCGSCGDVCPIKVPIPELIFYWRGVDVDKHQSERVHDAEETAAELMLRSSKTLAMGENMALWALRNLPQWLLDSGLNPWADVHANPEPPKETFREYYRRINKG